MQLCALSGSLKPRKKIQHGQALDANQQLAACTPCKAGCSLWTSGFLFLLTVPAAMESVAVASCWPVHTPFRN